MLPFPVAYLGRDGLNFLMLPESQHDPALELKMVVGLTIAGDISPRLVFPELGVHLGWYVVLGAPMPETTINKHGNLARSEGDVDSSAPEGRDSIFDAIPEASRM